MYMYKPEIVVFVCKDLQKTMTFFPLLVLYINWFVIICVSAEMLLIQNAKFPLKTERRSK